MTGLTRSLGSCFYPGTDAAVQIPVGGAVPRHGLAQRLNAPQVTGENLHEEEGTEMHRIIV